MNATALDDQVEAAAAEARRIIDAVASESGLTRSDHVAGPFAASMLNGIAAAAGSRRLRRCRHLKGGPAPSWAFAWRPGRLYCTPCAVVELTRTRGTVEDRRCDRCRHSFGTLWSLAAAAGVVVLTFGLCDDCYRLETCEAAA